MRLGKNIGSVYNKGKEIQRVYSKGKLVWECPPIDYNTKAFTVKCVSDRCYIQVRADNMKYSLSGGLYKDYSGIWYDADSGEEIELRGNGSRITIIASDAIGCYIRGKCDVYGNILSLIYGNDFSEYTDTPYKLNGFFGKPSSTTGSDIRSARNLILPPATFSKCYAYMFNNCVNLIDPPELPHTVLSDYCYQGMFYGCSSLTTAPELPANELIDGCYMSMFQNCTSLTSTPELPAT